MKKLFRTGKKKKQVKPGHLKIPIPMVNGVQYSNMTESQISTLLGGGNNAEPLMKKSASSITSRSSSKVPITTVNQPVHPTRSLSSPPILLMPKPVHSIPPTRVLLKSYEYEKTQVEESDDSSDTESTEEDIIELFPSNPIREINTAIPPIIEEKEEDVTKYTNDGGITKPLPNHSRQSLGSVTRTSEDSIRQYISASESPFSSIASVNHTMNHLNNQQPFSSSPLTSSPIIQDHSSPKNNPSTTPTNHRHHSFVSVKSFSSSNSLPVKDALPPLNTTSPTTSPTLHEEKTPTQSHNEPKIMAKQPKVGRPASSSSAFLARDVTPNSQIRLNNNNNMSSESSAQQQNHANLLEHHSFAISTMQKQQSSVNQDLEELKRTVDLMQQQRISDREEHLNRVKEQKAKENEILEQINATKQKLEMAIAGKFFMEDMHNTTDADNKAIAATLSQANELAHLQQQPEQHHVQVIEPPMMKPSISTSTASKPIKQQQQPRESRSRNRKSAPSRQQEEYASESYFPDVGNTDFAYMNHLHGPPQFFPPISNKYNRGGHPGRGFYQDVDNGFEPFDSPRMRNRPQRRERSKSVESQWRTQDMMDPPQRYGYDLEDPPMTDYRQHQQQAPMTPRSNRSRKSSTHSAKSNMSSEGAPTSHDLHSGYHSAVEEDEDVEQEMMGRPEEDTRSHYSARHRPRPQPNNLPPNNMMYSAPFGGPPMAHMNKMRQHFGGYNPPPPPPPPGNDYYYMPPQRVSPRMEGPWNNGPPPHHPPPQWGLNYGMPPPQQQQQQQGEPNVMNNNGEGQNNEGFGRRFPPQAQQTPQQSQHAYLPMYGDASHRLYM